MSGRSADGSGQTQPTQRIDVAMAQFEENPPTQALPVHEIRASAAQAVPPSYVAGGVPGVPQPHKRKKWPIVVAVIAAIALIGAVIGGVVYSHKHSEALARCRTAVSEFSDARKALLATSDDSPAIQRFIRNVLGVDDILDAVAKAATAAEVTVSDEGCATNATIIQLNLVADTLDSATDSLRESTKQIEQKARDEVDDALGGEDLKQGASDALDEAGETTGDAVDSAKSGLRSALDRAGDVLDDLRAHYDGSAVGSYLTGVLQKAVDAGQRLIDDSGIKDSKVYKAAEMTINEAIDAVNTWIDTQAAKAD